MVEVLSVLDLGVTFRQPGRRSAGLRAVDGVSFVIDSGRTVGLVGESGSGKSTIGRAVLGLTPATRGSIQFQAGGAGRRSSRKARAARLQAVFQDPYSSLNPLRTVGRALEEPLQVQGVARTERRQRIEQLLERVSLPADAVHRYPHEFSGGQRQRIAIARSLVLDPALVVCDEPISALDLSTQAAVLNLLQELQEQTGVAFLFIAHDLVAVRHLSDTVLVLYRGRVMESGPAADVCELPLHPYSRALWAAAPVPDPEVQMRKRQERQSAAAITTSASSSPPDAGCPFAPRCPFAAQVCWRDRPAPSPVDDRVLECHMFDRRSGHPKAGQGDEVMQTKPA